MLKKRWMIRLLLAGMLIPGAGLGAGRDYPDKPIRIVTGGSGGGSDFTARLIGQGLTASLGQQIIVDNRPSGIVPGEIVSRAQPDGHTLLVTGSTLWIAPLLQTVPWDAFRDFSPVTLAAGTPNILIVHPSVGARSVKDLIALAKARPGQLNYGTSGQGSSPHLAAELFKAMAGVNIVRISYKGASQALNDLIAGQVQMTFSTGAAVAQYLKSGRLIGLAVTSANPSALFPDLPTVAAAGLPGYELISPGGVFAPARTPRAIVNVLNREILRTLARPEIRERFLNIGVEPIGTTPEALADLMKSDVARLGKVIRDAGIRGE